MKYNNKLMMLYKKLITIKMKNINKNKIIMIKLLC